MASWSWPSRVPILEYLAECYGAQAPAELAHLEPARGTPAHRQCRFWMHYAEGSLMNWLVMQLVFGSIPRQPMPFFVRPVARALCAGVQRKLIQPNVQAALAFMEHHLAQHRWFAGEHLSLADFQMSFAVEAALARGTAASAWPRFAGLPAAHTGPPGVPASAGKGRARADGTGDVFSLVAGRCWHPGSRRDSSKMREWPPHPAPPPFPLAKPARIGHR